MKNIKNKLIPFLLPLGFAACAHNPSTDTFNPTSIPSPETSLQQAYISWFEGNLEDALKRLDENTFSQNPVNNTDPSDGGLADLLAAELYYEKADYPTARDAFLRILANHPDHKLVTWALVRLIRIQEMSVYNVPLSELNALNIQKFHDRDKVLLAYLTALSASQDILHQEAYTPFTQFLPLIHWRWVGPWKKSTLLDNQSKFEPEKDDWLKDSYVIEDINRKSYDDLALPAFTVPYKEEGIFYAETALFLEENTPCILALANIKVPYQLWVDGKQILINTPEQINDATFKTAKLTLQAGVHNIRLKLGVLKDGLGKKSFVQLIPLNESIKLANIQTLFSLSNEPFASLQLESEIDMNGDLPDNPNLLANYPFYAWLFSLYESSFGSSYKAERALEPFKETPIIPIWLQLAQTYQYNQDLAPAQRADLATTFMQTIYERAPQVSLAAYSVALQLRSLKYGSQALELLDKYSDYLPKNADIEITRYLLYKDLSWDNEAYLSIEKAIAMQPNNCNILTHYLNKKKERSVFYKPQELANIYGSDALYCPEVIQYNTDYYLKAFYQGQDQWKDILKQQVSLMRRYLDNLDYKLNHANVLYLTGEKEQALDLFDDILENPQKLPFTMSKATDLLDKMYAEEDFEKADQYLAKLLKKYPAQRTLLKLHWLRNSSFPLQHLRHDGIQIIKDYLATNPVENYSAEMLHDYAAYKYYEDGSSISVTQQITRILNKEGKNLMGEVYIPEDAIVTHLRTIKQNTLESIEPEVIANKPTITMPNLEVGDFIEVEYIEVRQNNNYNANYTVPIWFFKTADVPMKRSEFVIEYPENHELQVFTRLETPKPNCHTVDHTVRCSYLAENMSIPVPEPNTVHNFDLLPNIQFSYGESWSQQQTALYDRIRLSSLPTEYLKDCLKSITLSEDPLQTTKNIYQYVVDNITEGSGNYFAGMASWTAVSKTGSRMGLLKALLDLAKIPNTLIFIQPLFSPTLSSIPDFSQLYPYLMVTLDGHNYYLDPTEDFTPFDFLPTQLQGCPAVPIHPTQQTFFTTDVRPKEDSLIVTQLEFEIDAEGNLVTHGHEELRDVRAVKFRYAVQETQNDQKLLYKRLENILARTYGNVILLEFNHEHLNDTQNPFILDYRFSSTDFAKINDKEIMVLSNTLWKSATERYAPLAERKLPLLISSEVNTLRTLTFRVPETYSFAKTQKDKLPQSFEITSEFGFFRRTVSYSDEKLTSEDYFYIPQQIISPDQYLEFRDFCLKIDRSEAMDYIAVAK